MFYGPMAFGGWSWLGFGLHGVVMLLFWGVLIWAAIALVRAASRGFQSAPPADSALAELRERYARGELTAEQFTDMRRTLQ